MMKNIGQYRQYKSNQFYMPKWRWKILDNIGNINQINSTCQNEGEKYWTISAISTKSILHAKWTCKILDNIGNTNQINSTCQIDAWKYWTISAINIKSILLAKMMLKKSDNIGNLNKIDFICPNNADNIEKYRQSESIFQKRNFSNENFSKSKTKVSNKKEASYWSSFHALSLISNNFKKLI